jgi:hypothetical protein
MIVEELGGAIQFDVAPITFGLRANYSALKAAIGVDSEDGDKEERGIKDTLAWLLVSTRSIVINGESEALRAFENFWGMYADGKPPAEYFDFFWSFVPEALYTMWIKVVSRVHNEPVYPVPPEQKAELTDEERADPN